MHGSPCLPSCSPLPPRHTHVMLPRYVASVLWVWCRGRGAATHGGGGRNPAAATTPPPWVREEKKGVESCEMGLSRLFFWHGRARSAWNSFSNARACRPQPHFATTTTRVGWRWVDSRGLWFAKPMFSKKIIKIKNKCFVAFGLVGERRVGVEPVKFNLGVQGCF